MRPGVAPHRPYDPVAVAHQTATLDRLSGGRFTLGVGTGRDTAEFDAAGVPFAGRAAGPTNSSTS